MSGKGKESLAKYNSVLHNVNEYMTKNKIVNRPSDPKEQKVWAEKRKKDLAASHAEFLERKQKGQNLINPNVEISVRKEVRSDGSVRLSTKPRIDEIVKPKSKKGDPVIPKNPHFPMPIKHSEVVGDFLEHYGVKGMKWGKKKANSEEESLGPGYLNKEDQAEYDKLFNEYKSSLNSVAPLLRSGNFSGAIKALKRARVVSSGRLEVLIEKRAKNQREDSKRIDKMIEEMNSDYVLKQEDRIVGDFLEHYGVMGMKWGVRKRSKTRVSSSGARSTSPNPSSKVSAPTTRDKRVKALKNRRELSDSDIKDFTSRLQSEKQLKALLDEDVSPGRTFIKKVMSDAGKQAATKLATNALTYGTTKVMGKAFGKELEKALSGKKD
jgi:hypothetical protein